MRMLATGGRIAWQVVGILVALWLLGQLYVQLSRVLLAVFVALTVAAALTPVSSLLERRARLSRTVATIVVIAGLVIAMLGLGTVLAIRIADTAPGLLDDLRAQREPVLRWLEDSPLQLSEAEATAIARRTVERLGGSTGSSDDSTTAAAEAGTAATGAVGDGRSGATGDDAGPAPDDQATPGELPDDERGPSPTVAVEVFPRVLATVQWTGYALLGLVIAFFLLRDRDTIAEATVENLAGGDHDRLAYRVLRRSWRALLGYVKAALTVGAIEGVAVFVLLLVVGVPLPGVLGVLTFLAAFVPVVGAIAVGALCVLVALVAEGVGAAVVVGVAILVIQQLDGNVLQPVMMQQGTGLHPVATILALTVGGILGGVLGALLAVPVTAMVVAAARTLVEAGLGDPSEETALASS